MAYSNICAKATSTAHTQTAKPAFSAGQRLLLSCRYHASRCSGSFVFAAWWPRAIPTAAHCGVFYVRWGCCHHRTCEVSTSQRGLGADTLAGYHTDCANAGHVCYCHAFSDHHCGYFPMHFSEQHIFANERPTCGQVSGCFVIFDSLTGGTVFTGAITFSTGLASTLFICHC